MSRIFFTSDTHFGHHNIITYSKRPYQDVQEMNEKLISNWNEIVSPEDTVYHLGDFAMGDRTLIPDYLSRLNGNIILVRGNHDYNSSLVHFPKVKYKEYIQYQGKNIELIHNPYQASFNTDMVFCGHVHEQFKIAQTGYELKDYITKQHKDYGFKTEKPIINVGVDVWNYKPTSIEEILAEVNNGI